MKGWNNSIRRQRDGGKRWVGTLGKVVKFNKYVFEKDTNKAIKGLSIGHRVKLSRTF